MSAIEANKDGLQELGAGTMSQITVNVR